MLGCIRATLVALTLLVAARATATAAEAPYLAVAGDSTEQLPLTLTTADVTIAGVIADVSLKQRYENRGSKPIEAIYVFPGSARAAIYGLTMTIGDRMIRAQIRGKQKAREDYEAARESGKTASLLEQLDPSIFRMNVANILPGDRIDVELRYTELLVPDQGIYEFVLPNTLGGHGDAADSGVAAASTSSAAEVVDYSFDVRTRVRAALPLASVESPSHAVDVARPSPWDADVTLAESAIEKAATADYVLRYRLAGDQIQSGILAFPQGDGGYFLLMAEPPRMIADAAITPREFIFVVDVSGSMYGAPLDLTKGLIVDLFATLRPSDRFNVILFSGGSKVLAPGGSLAATPETLERVRKLIGDQEAGGGTELVPALETAYALPETAGMARSVVIVTDGQISAGGDAYRTVRSQLGQANAFAFGVGPNVDRQVIERLARAGAGEPFIVEAIKDGAEVAARMRRYIDRPLLTHIELGLDSFDAYDLEPSGVPDLLAERPVVVVGRYRGAAQGGVVVRGYSGSAPFEQRVALDARHVAPQLGALRQLWARTRIQRLLDEQAAGGWYGSDEGTKVDHEPAITELGLEHSLLTPYTSFVAVDERVRTAEAATPVNQPAVAKPNAAPAPGPAYYVSGTGSASGVIREFGVLAARAMPPSSSATARASIGGRRFVLVGGVWTDTRYRIGQRTLRVRRDSPAFARLLALAPELARVLALGERVVVVVGDYALVIGPNGFSDYPDATLRRALGLLG